MNELHVICKVDGVEYAIPAGDVLQMENFNGVTKMPGAPAYVAGLVQVRQQVVPVIDARVRFGLPAAPAGPEARLVVLKIGARLVGVLVDSAREVMRISAAEFHAPQAGLVLQTGGFIKAVAQLKGRIIMLIDSLKVIGEETANG